MAWLIATSAGLGIFILGVRRDRRRETVPLVAAAASLAPTPGSAPAAPPPRVDGPAVSVASVGPATETIPPWRRRVRDEVARRSGAVAARGPIRFTQPAGEGSVRRFVGFRWVRLGDAPDDVASTEVGRVDRGDEVEVLEATAEWSRVRTPAGLDGWLETHTLVDAPEDPRASPAS